MKRKLTPDNTGTCREILDAIYRVADQDEERAEKIWEAPTDAELDAIFADVIRRHGRGEYFWGAEGRVTELQYHTDDGRPLMLLEEAGLDEVDGAAVYRARAIDKHGAAYEVRWVPLNLESKTADWSTGIVIDLHRQADDLEPEEVAELFSN